MDEITIVFDFKTQNDEYHWSSCAQNPGHKSFIPVTEFRTEHLPAEYQDEDIVKCVKALADLTVRVRVKKVSENRLEGDKFYSVRGKQFERTGSGSVIGVLFVREAGACSCWDCRRMNQRQNVVARVFIHTARHVVFDASEAADTLVDLFYDNDSNCTNVRSLKGSKIVSSSEEKDECVFECPTHDRELAEKLKRMLDDYQHYQQAVSRTLLPRGSQLSHPYGNSEHISFGERKTTVDDCTDSGTTPSSPKRPRSGPFDGTVDSDKMVFVYSSLLSHIGHPSQASQVVGIELTVKLPDGTKTLRQIWQLDRRVVETKKWLLIECGIKDLPELYELVLELPGEESQLLKDEKNIDYYWDDLCRTHILYLRVKTATDHQQDDDCTDICA
ncbi:hypothetical protein BsWGS_28581 [Bradybaena similaris]